MLYAEPPGLCWRYRKQAVQLVVTVLFSTVNMFAQTNYTYENFGKSMKCLEKASQHNPYLCGWHCYRAV